MRRKLYEGAALACRHYEALPVAVLRRHARERGLGIPHLAELRKRELIEKLRWHDAREKRP